MNSDLSDVEVECSFHLKQTVDFTNIKIQKMMQLMDLPEGRTCHSPAKRDIKYENKESQTTFCRNESKESSTMTETVSHQNFCGMADIIASDRMIIHQNVEHFPENAFDAILWMLSIVIFRRQVEIMLNECGVERVQVLKSLRNGSRKIYRAIFNESKKLFALLISTEDDQLVLELFSSTNILKRTFISLGKTLIGKSYHVVSSYDLLFVSYEDRIILISLSTMKPLKKIKKANIISIIFPNSSSYLFVTRDGEFLNEKLERVLFVSPLMCPILDCFSFHPNKSNDLMIINEETLFFTRLTSLPDYKSMLVVKEFLLRVSNIIHLTLDNYCLFNKKVQKCLIIDISNRKITHEILFKRNEYTVDVQSYQGILYSLTSSGILSRWKVFPNGKLRREQTIILNLSYCKKIIHKSGKHIILQTISKLHLIPLFREF